MKPLFFLAVFAVVAATADHTALAEFRQDPAQQRADTKPSAARETVVLQRVSVPGTDREMGMGIADFPPNTAKPRQKATGPETCYVLEGEVTVEIEGQEKRVFHAGETFQFPAMVVHQTIAGPAGARVLATWSTLQGNNSMSQPRAEASFEGLQNGYSATCRVSPTADSVSIV